MFNVALWLIFAAGLVIASAVWFAEKRDVVRARLKNFTETTLAGTKTAQYAKNYLRRVVERSETHYSVSDVAKAKAICALAMISLVAVVRITDNEVWKSAYVQTSSSVSIFSQLFGEQKEMPKYADIYGAAVKETGRKFDSLSHDDKVAAIKAVLKKKDMQLDENEQDAIAEKVISLYDSASNTFPFKPADVLIVLIAFFAPEIVLLLNGVLQRSQYKRELVKLEGIFELLGGTGMKTDEIVKELAGCSGRYRRHFNSLLKEFHTDREKAISNLIEAGSARGFARFVEMLRVYSLNDKKTALDILARERTSREQQLLLEAVEDTDLLDLIALFAILPLFYEMFNMLLKPILSVVTGMMGSM